MIDEKVTSQEETTPREDTRPVATSSPNKARKGGAGKWIVVALVVAAAVILGSLYTTGSFGKGGDDSTVPTEDLGAAVAMVNGVKIQRAELNERLQQVRAQIPEGSPDVTADPGFELQLLNDLVSFELLRTEAIEKGFLASDEDVNAELAVLIESLGGEDMFAEQLMLAGITREKLVENMHNELMIQQLLDAETDIENVSVSDEEVSAMYDEVTADTPEEGLVPPLDQIQEILRAQLLQQKSAVIVEGYIETLREKAEIEITL